MIELNETEERVILVGVQQADGDDTEESVKELGELAQTAGAQVVGSVIQNRAEIRARQRTSAIVDTLSSDEIGALPDVTIAESMRRIAGVTTIYNDDIGQFASVRGLHPDLLPVQWNGMAIATTGEYES